MQETMRTDIYKDIKYYNWRVIPDVEDNDFKPLVDKVIDSNQSFLSQAQEVVVRQHY